jgi:hypothetical protein
MLKRLTTLFGLCLVSASNGAAAATYSIEVMAGNSLVIGGAKFTSKHACHGWYAGDPIRFISGSPDNTCEIAKLLNKRTRTVCVVICDPEY